MSGDHNTGWRKRQIALEIKAENARELGLDYEPSMTKDEEMLLRELAAEQCVISKVTARLGPMSLWSKDGLDAEIRRAVQAEREAIIDLVAMYGGPVDLEAAIRARGQHD
jgi:hypothetical protein